VYQYVGAAGRTSGSQNASATFALNPYDTNPQGIADPPSPDTLLAAIPAMPSSPDAAPPLTVLGADWGWLADPAPGGRGASLNPGDPGQPNRRDVSPFPLSEIGRLLGSIHAEEDVMAATPGGPRGTTEGGSPADDLALLDQVFAGSPF